MENEQQNKQKNSRVQTARVHLAVFGNVRVLVLAALMAAMSVVIATLAKVIFGTSPIRLTFENLPILFSAIAFGPFIGTLVGVAADLLSCLFAGQPPAPLITMGAAAMGLVGGLLGGYVFRRRNMPSLLTMSLLTHLVGTITLKTLALHLYYGYDYLVLLPRVPLYIGVGVAEGLLLCLLYRNKQISRSIERLCEKR